MYQWNELPISIVIQLLYLKIPIQSTNRPLNNIKQNKTKPYHENTVNCKKLIIVQMENIINEKEQRYCM